MRKLVSPRSILIVSLVGFTISIGIGLNEIYRHRLALDAQYKINAWLITQAELEMQRLVHTLDRYFSEVEPASHGDLAMRFDLFWSRLPVLLTGSQSEALRNVPGLEATILRIQADLEAIEKQILSLRPDDVVTYQAIRSRLMSHTGPLHDVVLAAIEHDSAKIEAERHAFRARYWQVGLSLFGALAGGAIFVGLLIRETRRTRHLLQVATAAEREAREARARLHEAIESISEGFMFYGADRKLLIANRKLRDIYFSISEMIVPGAAFDQLAIEAAYRGQYAGFTDPADAGRVDLFDFEAEGDHTIEMSDGRWIRVTRYATADGGCVSVHSDITELKKRETELAAKSAQLQATLDNISQGVGVFDAEYRLVTRNDRFLAILELPEELGQTGQDLDGILMFQARRGDFGDIEPDGRIAAEVLVEPRLELRLSTGRIVELEWGSMPDGGIVVTFADITERRLAEEQRQALMDGMHQSQKMQAIGTLAGGIAHDFNNVLASILGNAELALYDLDESHPAHEAVQQIATAGNHAANVVRQILAFSRHHPDEAKPVRVDDIVQESVTLLRATLPATIELVERRYCDHPVIVGDATQINQVIMNLGVNACHAIGERTGRITVELENVEIKGDFAHGLATEKRDATGQPIRILAEADGSGATLWSGLLTPGPHLRLTVQDTGCGMSYQTMSRMFEPFFTTKEVGAGTGLGLSAVHGIVMRHGGAIVVESRVGAGTTFSIFLPRMVEQGADPATGDADAAAGQGHERIMLVDDDPLVLNATARMLERAGYHVDRMAGSPDALDAFRAGPRRWDLVITDQTMPRMSGITLAEEMLRIRPDVAIVLCTGFSAMVDEQRAKEIGVRAFAQKPIVGQALVNLVRGVLDARQDA